MSKSEWKLIYSNYGGMEKKAVDLISAEAENYLNYPLPCEKSDRWAECNTIVVGSYRESGFIRQFIKSPELPPQGYVVKVIDHPCLPEAKLALITGEPDREVFYGAVDFVDDYFAASVPFHINLPRPARLLQDVYKRQLLDHPFHSGKSNAELVLQQFAHTAQATVAQMVDIIQIAQPKLQI